MRLWRVLKRGPSKDLDDAKEAHRAVVSQREEVEKIATSLRETVRKPNGLAPLLEQVLRSTR